MSTSSPHPPSSSSKPSLLPSPFKDSTPSPDPQPVQATTASIYSPDPSHSTSAYAPLEEPSETSQVPLPLFNPFFTLISDTATGEFHHPSTYYVFSDDENAADSIGTAALHSLDTYAHDPHSDRARGSTSTGEDFDIEERYVIVDFTTDAAGVADAQSLSPRWAVTTAKMSAAPMFGGGDNGPDGGMMLMVEGVSSGKDATRKTGHDAEQAILDETRAKFGGSITAAMGEILSSVNKELDMLEKVIGVEQELG